MIQFELEVVLNNRKVTIKYFSAIKREQKRNFNYIAVKDATSSNMWKNTKNLPRISALDKIKKYLGYLFLLNFNIAIVNFYIWFMSNRILLGVPLLSGTFHKIVCLDHENFINVCKHLYFINCSILYGLNLANMH